MGRILISGHCICGHTAEQHHRQAVVSEEDARELGTDMLPGACLFYGFNEDAGNGPNGEVHCRQYVDVETNSTKGGNT